MKKPRFSEQELRLIIRRSHLMLWRFHLMRVPTEQNTWRLCHADAVPRAGASRAKQREGLKKNGDSYCHQPYASEGFVVPPEVPSFAFNHHRDPDIPFVGMCADEFGGEAYLT